MSLSYSNALIVANGKKPHTALVLSDNEVINTVAAYMEHLVGIELTFFGWKPNVFTKSLQMQKQERPHMATFRICFISHKWNFSIDDKIE